MLRQCDMIGDYGIYVEVMEDNEFKFMDNCVDIDIDGASWALGGASRLIGIPIKNCIEKVIVYRIVARIRIIKCTDIKR